MATVRRSLVELLPALSLTGLGALGAGALLGHMAPLLDAQPGLLIMVPGLMAFRGDIHGSMGSRLGSAVHLGLLSTDEPVGPVARSNLAAAMALSIIIAVAVGVLGWAVSVGLGLEAISVWVFIGVAVATGLISGFLLSAITLSIVLVATRRGLDPDNITSPLLTTVGDVITLGVLLVVLGVL